MNGIQELANVLEHMQGKHNQTTHAGKGGGVGGNLSILPAIKKGEQQFDYVQRVANKVGYNGEPIRSLRDINNAITQSVVTSNKLQTITNKMFKSYMKSGMTTKQAQAKVETSSEWKAFTGKKPDLNKLTSAYQKWQQGK